MAEGAEGGGKKKLILIIVAVVLLIVIGAVAFLMMGGDEEEEELPEEELPVTETVEPLATPLFLPLESYVVNLKDGRRYLKATIQLMMSDPAAMGYLQLRMVEVKDAVLTELQEVSAEDVAQAEAREALKQRLINVISKLFPTKPEWEDPEPIRKVLFEEFVIQ
jgi:flagellar FliL protein